MEHVHTMTETETVDLKKSLAELKQGLVSLAASFIEIANLFITRFKRPSALETGTENTGTIRETPAASTETSATTPMTSPKNPVTTLETTQEPPGTTLETGITTPETPKKRPENTKEILLRMLQQHPRISTPELAQATGLSVDGVKYHLNQLKRTGKLLRHGPTKGGYWEVIDEATK